MVGLDLRQHDGDGLRVFVLQIVGQHLLIHVGQLVPHGAAGRTADLLHDGVDLVLAHDLGQQALGAVEGTDQRAGGGNLFGEFDEQSFDQV